MSVIAGLKARRNPSGQLLLSKEETLEILQTKTPHREVYRLPERDEWRITYGGGRTTGESVEELARLGMIVPVYNTTRDIFHIGRTIDVAATLSLRKKTGARHVKVYVKKGKD